jgi:uncharacterized membrane protein YkoI
MDMQRMIGMSLGALALGLALLGTSAGAPQQAPAYTSSTQVQPDNPQERGRHEAERREAAQLMSLARIDVAQATAAALVQVPGTVLEAGLDNENGHVVYSVEIMTSTHEVKDVKVDAGTGDVLHVESGGTGEDDEDD